MKRTPPLLAVFVALAAAQWEPCAPLPSPRYSGAAVALGGKIYYIGGSIAGSVKQKTVFVYDPQADTWTVGDSLPDARHRFGAAVRDSSIYVFGGWSATSNCLGTGYRYDKAARTWTPIETLPAPRASVFAAADPSLNGKVYCMGGWDGSRSYNTNFEYDPETGHWRTRAPMPTTRCEGSCVFYGYPICIGGTPDGSAMLDVVESYDAWADTWYTWVPLPAGRAAMAGVTDARCLWVIGGVGTGNVTLRDNCEIDYHAMWRDREPLPSPRRYTTACYVETDSVAHTGHIYLIGGQDSLIQPVATVLRWPAPLAVEESPAVGQMPQLPAVVLRSGMAIRSPFGARASGTLFAPDGRIVAEVTAGAACPALGAGPYFIRWQVGNRVAATRLVVVR